MIYHLSTPDNYIKFKGDTFFGEKLIDLNNFIHCSFQYQIDSILQKFYHDYDEIFLIEINEKKLKSNYLIEGAPGDLYPHVYGPINSGAIENVFILRKCRDCFILPWKKLEV